VDEARRTIWPQPACAGVVSYLYLDGQNIWTAKMEIPDLLVRGDAGNISAVETVSGNRVCTWAEQGGMSSMRERRGVVAVLFVMMSFLGARTTSGQVRVPDRDMSAVTAEAGFFFPKEIFDTAAIVAGSYEFYLQPRTSIRGTLAWTDPNFERSGDSLRQIRLLFELVYNWERGKWHPFAAAGAGIYFLQHKFSGRSSGLSETKGGVNLGGGIEYFVHRTVVVKGEAGYSFVGQGDLPWSPSGFTLTGGIKKYF